MMFSPACSSRANSLPVAVQLAGRVLPLSHGIDLVRGITLGSPLDQAWLHLLVLLAYGWAACCWRRGSRSGNSK